MVCVHTILIQEYYVDIPRCAILSHTWNKDEVPFVENVECTASSLKGYEKTIGCCKQPVYGSLNYVVRADLVPTFT